MINIECLWNAMPRDVQRKISCHDLKRTVDAYNKNDDWHSMQSAPSDGTVFLAFVPHSQGGYAFAAFLNTENRLLCMMSHEDLTARVTHWMPLPEFPKSTEQTAFETWLETTCPSGDHESVKSQWEASSDLRDFWSKVCRTNPNSGKECPECEGTGQRSFVECDDLVPCVDCSGTGMFAHNSNQY